MNNKEKIQSLATKLITSMKFSSNTRPEECDRAFKREVIILRIIKSLKRQERVSGIK